MQLAIKEPHNMEDIFSNFVQTITRLRDPENGCPWDLKQTHYSLIKYLIEETFEAVHAIEESDDDKIKDELGDILLQVVLHSVIAKQRNKFSIEDVIQNINDKMVRRHPHVFAGKKINSIDEVKQNWEKIKKSESQRNNSENYTFNKSILDTTSLLSANKIGEKTKKVDFDWNSYEEVILKVKEELSELEDEIKSKRREAKILEEYGDLLFSCVQLGRHLSINPENALRSANKKFIKRFDLMEDLAHKNKQDFSSLSREKKEQLWKKVKGMLKSE